MANPKRGSNLDSFAGGTEAGVPLVLFDQQLRTTVISPLNHFANAVQVKSDQLAGHLACGLSGRIDRLPPAFSQETIIFAGQGVNQTLFDWGSQLLKQGGKSRLAKSSDKTANYLGYCTDNGAYYYYNTEGGKTYEETIVDISHSLKQEGYPAQYLQLDSWWYEKGRDQGTSLWEPRADIFVHSLADLHAETRLPFAAHNRYWSASNKYNTAYRFIVENAAAVPDDPDFWRHIMSWSRQNGICMYEQDWLNVIYERSPALQSDPLLSERWLGQMDQAASQAGLHIMYCMALPSHYLASTLYPSVSRVRATNDYCPGNDQWKMGLSSMLSWALGLAPFKDVFWSSEKQASNPYKNATVTEPNFELQALVSALSGGGVATGDKIGSLNKTLVAKTCRTDGLLLKADKPATPIDRCFQPDAPTGEIWGTQTSIGGLTWRFLLVADQTASYTLKASDLSTHSPYMVLETESGQLSLLTENDCLSVGGTTPPRPGAVPLQYFVFAPVGKKGLTFLGEVDKFITVSRQRFTAISPDGGHLKLTGAPNEEVNLAWHCRGKSRRISYNDRIVKADDALVKVHRQDQLLHLSVRLDQSGQGSVEISI